MGIQKRMKFLAVVFVIGAASSFKISSKEDLIKRFGEKNVSFDPNVRTNYCNQCMEITVSSTGGALEHQPNRLGKFSVAGSLWDNMVPFWVADNVGSLNSGIMNDAYTSGINCPYEIPDQWEY